MIEFKCPSCAAPIQVGDDFAGRRGRCLNCKTVVQIPHVTAEPPPPPPPLNDGPADAAIDQLVRATRTVAPAPPSPRRLTWKRIKLAGRITVYIFAVIGVIHVYQLCATSLRSLGVSIPGASSANYQSMDIEELAKHIDRNLIPGQNPSVVAVWKGSDGAYRLIRGGDYQVARELVGACLQAGATGECKTALTVLYKKLPQFE